MTCQYRKAELRVQGSGLRFWWPLLCLQSLRVVDTEAEGPLSDRFVSQAGVTVEVTDFGSPQCAPIYFPLYLRFIAAGYSIGEGSGFEAVPLASLAL